ncbi:hypothetical protein GCM10022245_30220 [Streptomyces mayteni]
MTSQNRTKFSKNSSTGLSSLPTAGQGQGGRQEWAVSASHLLSTVLGLGGLWWGQDVSGQRAAKECTVVER